MTNEKIYPVFYRAGYRHDGRDTTDKDAGTVFLLTMAQILEEINSNRSADWTAYTEEDWEEGLDEWTCFHPITEYRQGNAVLREYDINGKWRLVEVIGADNGRAVKMKAPFCIMSKDGTCCKAFASLKQAFMEFCEWAAK